MLGSFDRKESGWEGERPSPPQRLERTRAWRPLERARARTGRRRRTRLTVGGAVRDHLAVAAGAATAHAARRAAEIRVDVASRARPRVARSHAESARARVASAPRASGLDTDSRDHRSVRAGEAGRALGVDLVPAFGAGVRVYGRPGMSLRQDHALEPHQSRHCHGECSELLPAPRKSCEPSHRSSSGINSRFEAVNCKGCARPLGVLTIGCLLSRIRGLIPRMGLPCNRRCIRRGNAALCLDSV